MDAASYACGVGLASLCVEDLGSLGLTPAAFLVPVLAALAVLAFVVVIVVAWRRSRCGG